MPQPGICKSTGAETVHEVERGTFSQAEPVAHRYGETREPERV